MIQSKIAEFNLQSQFLPIYHKSNRNITETARELSDIAGETISNMAVTRYLKTIKKTKPKLPTRRDTKEEVQKVWLEEKDIIVGFYQEVIQKAVGILRNAKTDRDALSAISVTMQTLNKALESHGIGGGPKVQINQQFNTIVIDEKKDQLLKVLRKYVNGNSNEFLNDLREVFAGN